MTSRKRTKVGSACERCRAQKLKCDIQRPCTLCLRAGIDCQSGTIDQWRSFQSPQTGPANTSAPKRKRAQRTDQSRKQSRPSTSTEQQQPWSSSTMSLVEGAFHFHNSSTPDSSLITALPGTTTGIREPRKQGTVPVTNPRLQEFQSTIKDLVSLLPSREVAALLVDTYFDRVHWFMLIFHQEDFRRDWQAMYDSRHSIENYPNPAFLSTFLVVIAIALQYTGSHRQHLLREYGVDPSTLKEKILSIIRAKLLDIVSLASLEAVQTCVLLGTYYLYHGNPGLAWPVCGCGLRLAQALNLHRMVPGSDSTDPEIQRKYETRKRCWWAIYEIETFCSMSYGYPLSIKDADCDVELLDPLFYSSMSDYFTVL
ncbi:fungal-specific transcription factor domain-containing protein [Penicillium herquei]|nr:fungal-specific transcription factor domain-containing protein [Penicillium herquei]